jgi:general stress protein 26
MGQLDKSAISGGEGGDAAARQRLWRMVKDFRFAMMTTLHPGNVLRSRPMTTIDRAFDGTLSFFAHADSGVTNAIAANPQVCLAYGDPGRADFVCVAGPAVLVDDAGRKRELWSPAVQAWFPEGAEASSVLLIELTPDHAEYWDSKSSRITQLFSMARAVATGTTPAGIGEHRNVPV